MDGLGRRVRLADAWAGRGEGRWGDRRMGADHGYRKAEVRDCRSEADRDFRMAAGAAADRRDVAGRLRLGAWHQVAGRKMAGPNLGAAWDVGQARRLGRVDWTCVAAGHAERVPDAAPVELESAEQREREAWLTRAERRAAAAVVRERQREAGLQLEQALPAVLAPQARLEQPQTGRQQLARRGLARRPELGPLERTPEPERVAWRLLELGSRALEAQQRKRAERVASPDAGARPAQRLPWLACRLARQLPRRRRLRPGLE